MALALTMLAFVFGTLLVVAIGVRMAGSRATAMDRRLRDVVGTTETVGDTQPSFQAIVGALKRMGSRVPRSPSEMGKLRLRLVRAGFRGEEALAVFFGLRLVLALGAFALFATPVLMRPSVPIAAAACGIAWVLPGMVLARMMKRRQHLIRLALPDALDLLVVSVEAGLGLDQAMQRVGDELHFAHPDLSNELRLVNLELRAGKGRMDALHNMAERTGVDDVQSLVAIQTDRFGTSIAKSLRVHSETLRTKRRQRAEEAAAKTGVKMVFPLVFCIFPAIFVVTIGPAAIKFVTVLFPVIKK
jgi:tight adherence protein C